MSYDDRDTIILSGVVFLVAIIGSLFVGTIYGIELGEKSATKETVKICVEKPQECKIMYEFYKLSESKK